MQALVSLGLFESARVTILSCLEHDKLGCRRKREVQTLNHKIPS
jgi:hypothetical protein